MSGELIVKNNDSKKTLLAFLITAAVVLAVMLPMAPVLIVVLQPEMMKLISGGKKPATAVIPWSIRNRVLLLGDVEIPQKSIKMVHCWQKNGAWTVNIETTGKNRLLRSADGADAEDSIQSLYDLVDALGYRSQWKEV